MVRVAARGARDCPDCGTRLSHVSGDDLCPHCLLALALEASSEPPVVADETEAATLELEGAGLQRGRILGNRYRIRSLLGRGGMGEVWRAHDLKLRVDVALKALHPGLLESGRALETLRQEVRVAREVVSPNVCRVYDLVEIEERELVSMEYVDGTTLAEVLRARGPLELEEARGIAAQLLAGLEAIHEARLVHRDVKPENVMLTRAGRVVLMDFGIAKGLAEARTGTVSGTPAYMAPEQARGDAVDARADVFSAGVVLAEMVAPEGVATPEARQTVWRDAHHEPPRAADTPWAAVLQKALARRPDQRYAGAAALARALEEVTLRVAGAEDLQPYPGLASFTADDAEYFFGREYEIEAMWKRLRRAHLLGLIGPSGAGKSSFLRAGLLPAMPAGWAVIVSSPGSRPIPALARALAPELAGDAIAVEDLTSFDEPDVAISLMSRWRQGHEQALVVVDQFEELFTLNPGEVQQAFAELLGRLALEADVRVLLAMRDDFLFRCHPHEALAPLFSELTPLGPPTGAALRRAVVQPALKCGYRFEDDALVDDMLAEVEGERGALPLLAFAAARLWEERDREQGLLARAAYEQIGGVAGALAQHAEATLEKIGSERVPVARELFRNLVTSQGTRAARERDELLSVFEGAGERTDAAVVLDTLVDARLLTSYEAPPEADEERGRQRIEIVHESLLASWPRLVRWQTQDTEGAQLRDELRQAARMWEQHGRSKDLLWTGTAFREFQLWRERYPGGLTELETAFGDALTRHAERRRRRRRAGIAVSMLTLIAVLAVVTWSRFEAVAEARRAEAAKLLAIAQLQLGTEPTAALAYTTASLELADTAEARRFALTTIARGPLPFRLPPISARPWDVDFSPDGQWLAVGYDAGRGIQLHARAGGSPRVIEAFGGGPWSVVFGADSRHLLSGGDRERRDRGIEVRTVPGGELLRTLPHGLPGLLFSNGEILTVPNDPEFEWFSIVRWPSDDAEPVEVGTLAGMCWGFDPTGRWVAFQTPGDDEGFDLWVAALETTETSTPVRIGRRLGGSGPGFSADGSLLAAADPKGNVELWSLTSSAPRREAIRSSPGPVTGLKFGPGDRHLAAAHWDGAVTLWDLEGPPAADPTTWTSPTGSWTTSASFEPGGRWLAAASPEEAVRLWPLTVPRGQILRGHSRLVSDLAFGPDGAWIATTSNDGSVRIWPLSPDGGASQIFRHPELPAEYRRGVAVAPDGSFVIVGSSQVGGVTLFPLDGGEPRVLSGLSSAYVVDVSRDARLVAAGGGEQAVDQVVRVWNLESGEESVVSAPSGGVVTFLRFRPRGDLVFAQGGSTYAWQLGAESPRLLLENVRVAAMDASGDRLLGFTETGVDYNDLEQGLSEAVVIPQDVGEINAVALDASGRVAIAGTVDGIVSVQRIGHAIPHLYLGHEGLVRDVEGSPDARWIASAGADTTLRIWPMPDLDKPPLHTLPLDELIAKLESLTNLRAVRDPESPTGWAIEVGPFPGWDVVPTW